MRLEGQYICSLRFPYDSILALFSRQYTGNHLSRNDENSFF